MPYSFGLVRFLSKVSFLVITSSISSGAPATSKIGLAKIVFSKSTQVSTISPGIGLVPITTPVSNPWNILALIFLRPFTNKR